MEIIQPGEREAVLAALAKPARCRNVTLLSRHEVAALELARLAANIRQERLAAGLPALLPPGTPRSERLLLHRPQCRHTNYHLTCDEFEMLERESDGFCDICSRDLRESWRPLHIDHDHALGWRAVRGMVCASCNQLLAAVDARLRQPDRATANYLADPWFFRVGLEDLACPADCGDSAHTVIAWPVRVAIRRPGRTPTQQRQHLAAQLWASA